MATAVLMKVVLMVSLCLTLLCYQLVKAAPMLEVLGEKEEDGKAMIPSSHL